MAKLFTASDEGGQEVPSHLPEGFDLGDNDQGVSQGSMGHGLEKSTLDVKESQGCVDVCEHVASPCGGKGGVFY